MRSIPLCEGGGTSPPPHPTLRGECKDPPAPLPTGFPLYVSRAAHPYATPARSLPSSEGRAFAPRGMVLNVLSEGHALSATLLSRARPPRRRAKRPEPVPLPSLVLSLTLSASSFRDITVSQKEETALHPSSLLSMRPKSEERVGSPPPDVRH